MMIAGAALDCDAARAASVGAVLGVDRGGISGDGPPNTVYESGAGWILGVQGEIGIARDISLSLQPMYVQRHTDVVAAEETSAAGDRLLELSLDYVNVPLLVKFGAAGGRTYVSGGVEVGFLMAARLAGNGLDADVKASLNSMAASALLGFGVVFPIGRPSLTTELRYAAGLVDLSADDSAAAIRDLPDRFHSDGWQLTAGILFPLGER